MHARGIDALLDRLESWARESSPTYAGFVLLARGHAARGTQHARSDVDLVLLTHAPAHYANDEAWIRQLGGRRVARTRTWGAVTERRIEMPGAVELDVAIATPLWARTDPVDPGTAHVVSDGIRPLHDPDELLGSLINAVRG